MPYNNQQLFYNYFKTWMMKCRDIKMQVHFVFNGQHIEQFVGHI